MLTRGMDLLSSYIDRTSLSQDEYLITVFNSVQQSRTQLIECVLEFPTSENIQSFSIFTPDGLPVTFHILSHEVRAKGIVTPINLPGVVNVDAYRILLPVHELPGLSYRTYTVVPHKAADVSEQSCSDVKNSTTLENKYLCATILPNGTVNLLHKASGHLIKDLLLIEDEAEIGDSYIHFDLPSCSPVSSVNAQAEVTTWTEGEFRQCAKIQYTLQIPSHYCEKERNRSADLCDLPICINLTLEADSPYLNVRVTLKNQAKDHRIRMKFPTGTKSDISFSGNPFDIIKRDRRDAHTEGHIPDQPNTEFIAIDEDSFGTAIFNKGLYEYEHCMDDSVLLTLLRCQEYISHDPYGEGLVEDKWRTSESQCQGEHTLEMAIYPYSGNHISAHVAHQAQCFCNPMLIYCQPVDIKKFAGGRPFVQGSDIPEYFFRGKAHPEINLPATNTFCTIEDSSGAIVLSALKRAEQRQHTILRLYNTSSLPVEFGVRFKNNTASVFLTDLSEEAEELLSPSSDGYYHISAREKEIITISVKSYSLLLN